MDNTEENQVILRTLVEDLEKGFHLFYKYYTEYKSDVGENMELLFRKRDINQISVNWENEEIKDDYISEMQVLLYRIHDISALENYDEGDIEDCYNFVLGKYKSFENNGKNKKVHGNLIRVLYYMYINFDMVYINIYNDLIDSLYESFHNYSKKTILSYLLLEIIGILIYIIFFLINFYFLYKSNIFIFQNILSLFLDFTQLNNYTFNNKIDNLLIHKAISNYISLVNDFSPKMLESLKAFGETCKKVEYTQITYVSDKNVINDKNNNPISKLENKSGRSSKSIINKIKPPINKINSQDEYIKKRKNSINKILAKDTNKFAGVSSFKNNNILNLNDITNHNNSSLMGLNDLTNSLNNNIFLDNKDNNNNMEDDDMNLTIDKIVTSSKMVLIRLIKNIMVIFIILSFLFIIYYIIKIIFGFLIISNISVMFDDFKILCSQYNEVIRYWNNIKTLFILPKASINVNFTNIEPIFVEKNQQVSDLVSKRIKNYKKTAELYSLIMKPKDSGDLVKADFCRDHYKCIELLNSTQNILVNGINSAVLLYVKEIENYNKDYNRTKNLIKTIDDIKKYYIKDTFIVLGININQVIIHLQEKFFLNYLIDEEDIEAKYKQEIKILNFIALLYCFLLNLFAILYVFNYINLVIDTIETSSFRITSAIYHLKHKIIDNFTFI